MYARIMVEAIMNQELLEFENEKGIIMTQQVMYEWCLVQCSRCQDIGHIGNKCKHKKQLVQPWKKWVPKKITKRCRWVCEGGTTIYTLQQNHVPVVVENRFVALQDEEEIAHGKEYGEKVHEIGIHGEQGESPTING